MRVKLNWSYNSGATGNTAVTKFLVQYKLSSASWPSSCVPANNNATSGCIEIEPPSTACSGNSCSYTFTSGVLDDNKSYDFRVGTVGLECGSQFTPSVTKIEVLCPTMSNGFPSSTASTISYEFPGAVNTSITEYLVGLYLATDTSFTNPIGGVQTKSMAATISGQFTGLSPSTAYKLRVTVKSSGADKICLYDKSTTATPPCEAATGLTACICGVDCAEACS